jgi:hypothetical protein
MLRTNAPIKDDHELDEILTTLAVADELDEILTTLTDDDEDEMESLSLLSGGRPTRTRFELKGVVPFGIATWEDADTVTTGVAIETALVDVLGIWPGGGEPVIAFAAAALSAAFSATYISKWFEGGGRIPDDTVKAPGRMSVANWVILSDPW